MVGENEIELMRVELGERSGTWPDRSTSSMPLRPISERTTADLEVARQGRGRPDAQQLPAWLDARERLDQLVA